VQQVTTNISGGCELVLIKGNGSASKRPQRDHGKLNSIDERKIDGLSTWGELDLAEYELITFVFDVLLQKLSNIIGLTFRISYSCNGVQWFQNNFE
jgi:hypothetical protein